MVALTLANLAVAFTLANNLLISLLFWFNDRPL